MKIFTSLLLVSIINATISPKKSKKSDIYDDDYDEEEAPTPPPKKKLAPVSIK